MKNSTRSKHQSGFLNISLASAMAGIMIVVHLITATFHKDQTVQPTMPVTQTVTADQTTTTDILPPNPLDASTASGSVQTPAVSDMTASGQVAPTPTGSAQVAAATTAPKDCDTDSDCLIAAVQTCTPSSATLTSAVDILGMSETIKNKYQIIGPDSSNNCQYSSTIVSATVSPDADFKKEAAIHKTSLANIQSDLGPAQTQLNSTIGTTTTCSQPILKVTQVIAGFSQGELSAQYLNTNDPACSASNTANQ